MIPKEKELKLIKIYMYICDVYQFSLKFNCQRFSNNANSLFTDEELLTVYLFCGAYQRYLNIKDIYTFTKEYLLSWFPNLPSYQTFNYRLNRISEAISEFVKHLITFFNQRIAILSHHLLTLCQLLPVQERTKSVKLLLKLQLKDTAQPKTCIISGSNFTL